MSDKKRNDEKKVKITLSKGILVYIFVLIIISLGGPVLYVKIMNIQSSNGAIGALSSFYSMVFTIVAIFIGIAGLIAWRWIRDEWAEKEKQFNQQTEDLRTKWNEKEENLNQQTKQLYQEWNEMKEELSPIYAKFKGVEKDVDFLKERHVLAKWVQELFDKDDKKKILSKQALPILTLEDKEKYKKIQEKILKDATDDSWLNIVYAKKLMEQAEKCLKSFSKKNGEKDFSEIQNTYKKVEKIFKFIEDRDLFNPDSDIEMNLHNLHGGLYWEWYKAKKLEFQKKFQNKNREILWEEWWRSKEQGKKKHAPYNLLKNSEIYYRNALEITEEKKEDENQTLGNLSLVLIELSKFFQNSEKSDILKEAKNFLDRVDDKDFNWYWDSARVLYYLNPDENYKEIKGLLNNAVKEIDNKKDRDFFIKRLKAELNERIDGDSGFPGTQEAIDNLIG